MDDVILARSEVAVEYTWDAESIFSTAQDWNDEFKSIDSTLESLDRFQGTLGSGPSQLLE